MSDALSFGELLRSVRAGDSEAARTLVLRYEGEIRRIVRVRLTDPRMRRQIDSVDICQSVLGDFFVRVGMGQFDLESPEQLIKLLAVMARNKFLNHVARQQAARRDVRKIEAFAEDLPAASDDTSPSQAVANRELLQEFRARLRPEERVLAERRADGCGWAEVAGELNENADALRMRLQRGIDRVSQELGLEI